MYDIFSPSDQKGLDAVLKSIHMYTPTLKYTPYIDMQLSYQYCFKYMRHVEEQVLYPVLEREWKVLFTAVQ